MTRNEQVERHMRLVPLTRKRLIPSAPPHMAEDLESEGYLGLVRAAERYDPARGVAFRTMAISWIKGAMLNYLRCEDWTPRPLRQRERAGEDVEILEVVSLEATLYEDESAGRLTTESLLVDPREGPEAATVRRLEERVLRRAVACLPRRERHVVAAWFFGSRTNEQIGAALGVSASRALQLRLQALSRLRAWLVARERVDGG